ncbi:MAG: hypothetical protein QGH74_06725 [Candidatus Brocadiia bacterium]|nr:hypothetical protein [Candidatus Brocadiia bacterium]
MKWRLDDGQIEVVDDAMAEVLRQKMPAERMVMVGSAWRFARMWIEGAVRSQHGDWEEDRVAAEVRRRLNGGTA